MLSDLLNDCEAATKARICIGTPLREEQEFPHPYNYANCPNSIVIGAYEGSIDSVCWWFEEHATGYGYRYKGSYIGSVILVPAMDGLE